MSNKWEFLFEEGEDFANVRRRRMEKTAGVFMRPSDIGSHTELAGALEGLLNGQPGGSTFKDHPGAQKTAEAVDAAIGGVIGGVAGYMSTRKVNPVPPPQNTQGMANKLQQLRHDNYKFIEENPRMAKTIASAAGSAAGAYALKDANIVQRLRDFKRGSK